MLDIRRASSEFELVSFLGWSCWSFVFVFLSITVFFFCIFFRRRRVGLFWFLRIFFRNIFGEFCEILNVFIVKVG